MKTAVRKIRPFSGTVDAAATPPGSKSITNRALLIAALARGESTLTGGLDSEDTRVMTEALRTLGIKIESDGERLKIVGCGGSFPVDEAELYVANSGTTARFLTAALGLARGNYRIDGKERMRARPIGDLLRALERLGANVQAEAGNDCPPILIRPAKLPPEKAPLEAAVAGNVSSQFLSALLMAAPITGRDVRLTIEREKSAAGELVSRPYVTMTTAMTAAFGVRIEESGAGDSFFIPADSVYRGREYRIEPDASAASYFFAVPAILGGRMTVAGLSKKSLQGDVAFVDCLAAMGCRVRWGEDEITVEREISADGAPAPLLGIDVDMNDISDTAQTLTVVALFAETPTRIRNIAHVRGKETDRIAAVVTELRKFGVRVEEYDDGLGIWPDLKKTVGARIATYDDHRMAMSFSLAGLKIPGVEIENPTCVEKTYPLFFTDLEKTLRRC